MQTYKISNMTYNLIFAEFCLCLVPNGLPLKPVRGINGSSLGKSNQDE
jgi:hypothetical protein